MICRGIFGALHVNLQGSIFRTSTGAVQVLGKWDFPASDTLTLEVAVLELLEVCLTGYCSSRHAVVLLQPLEEKGIRVLGQFELNWSGMTHFHGKEGGTWAKHIPQFEAGRSLKRCSRQASAS